MTKELRYAVTVDLYVYTDTEEDAKAQAKNIVDKLQQISDNKASVVSIHEAPFGKIGNLREVK